MKIILRTYNGLAGDDHELLIADTEDGARFDTLFNRSWFPLWSLRKAKKKLIKEIEIITGQTVEVVHKFEKEGIK